MSALREFRRRAAAALGDAEQHTNLRSATAVTLAKRERLEREIEGYAGWRRRVAEIRREGWERREELLTRATERLESAGARVHRAKDAREARRLVLGIARDAGARRVVKGKSMLGEEIGLGEELVAGGLEVWETDLGEFIVQLAGEAPSHITAPALHKNREQIGRLFAAKLGVAYTDVPEELTAIARRFLREKFLAADLGVSGANFVVAETGTLILVENEGNIGLCTTLPRVHVALTGIEKMLPRLADVDPLLRLLPPNCTGQRAASYVSLLSGPAPPGDGPEELHVVFVDNGRSALAASAQREILACIRCGSCLNVCPIFRHVGGHAYGSVYPGPMGILLSPQLTRESNSLADVCSLCGACGEICPAEIPLPELILGARTERERSASVSSRLLWRGFGQVAGRTRLMRIAGAALRLALRLLPTFVAERLTRAWSDTRVLPAPPQRSFRGELRRRHPGRVT